MDYVFRLLNDGLFHVFVFALFIAFVWKRKRSASKPLEESSSDRIEGTLEDLARAEKQAAQLARDPRTEILVRHEFLERFSTISGFTREFVEDQAERLRRVGISAEVYFQETLQPGVDGFLTPQGSYELYIERGQKAEALRTLQEKP